jgi:hypothetical protein
MKCQKLVFGLPPSSIKASHGAEDREKEAEEEKEAEATAYDPPQLSVICLQSR